MALVIMERFVVDAPADRVWSYLTDPAEVVTCMPGAELSATEPDGTVRGRITVKVGPLAVVYAGSARFDELDATERRARIVAKAREASGSGTAAMTLTSTIVEAPEGGAEVRIHASVDLTGKIVQFGRGLIDDVSRQIIRQFASCMQATLAEEAAVALPEHATEEMRTTTGSVKRRPSVEAIPMVRGALWRSLLRMLRRLVGAA